MTRYSNLRVVSDTERRLDHLERSLDLLAERVSAARHAAEALEADVSWLLLPFKALDHPCAATRAAARRAVARLNRAAARQRERPLGIVSDRSGP